MAKTDWYTVHTIAEGGYTVHKYDKEGEHAGSYELNQRLTTCDCPAHVPYCRHKAIVTEFLEHNRVGTGWLYNHDSKEWQAPKKIDMGADNSDLPPAA